MTADKEAYAIDDPPSLGAIDGRAVMSKKKLCDELADKLMKLPGTMVAKFANDILLMVAGEKGLQFEFKYRGDDEFEIRELSPTEQ